MIHGWRQLHPSLRAGMRRREHGLEMSLVSETIESRAVGWRRYEPLTWLAETARKRVIVDRRAVLGSAWKAASWTSGQYERGRHPTPAFSRLISRRSK